MPFITKDRRTIIRAQGLRGLEVVQDGDICFQYYYPMVARWNVSPRWTTAHGIYQDLIILSRDMPMRERAAYQLAWQVFFQLYVMPYELQKRQENGDI